jgi:chromosomal replication initiator protein
MESAMMAGPAGRGAAGPWDDFLVGPANVLAHAGVLALARGERAGIAPLVVHGPAGVGKTRLLAGLVGEMLLRQPGAAVAMVAAEEFAAACAEAAGRPGGWSELRERFRHLDLFALDDLPALAPAPLALAELAHTLDSLEAVGAAVAVSARTGPGQWSDLPARLVSRLGGGLAARIEPPDRDARRQYLLARARTRGLTVAADALERLAEAADGYRALDGLLNRLALESKLGRRPIDLALVAGALDEPGAAAAAPTIDQVARAVAARFGVRLRDLRSASRRQGVIGPRHLAMHLARVRTGASFAAIGAYFGGRDPATVRHACRMAQERLAADPALAAVIFAAAPR